MIARRTFLAAGAAGLLLPGAGAAQSEVRLDGAWTTGFVGTNGTIPVLATMRLTITGQSASMSDVMRRGFSGRMRRVSNGGIILDFQSSQTGRPGSKYRGRLVGPDRMEGVFQREDGFETELAFVRGDTPPTTLPMPPLTAGGLQQTIDDADFPAMAAVAARRGGAIAQWQAGVRQRGARTLVAPGDLWFLGSCTKSMTATLAARLVERGALSFDDTVEAVLGAAAPQMRAEYRQITLRHLLTHRAGLQRDMSIGNALALPRSGAGPAIRLEAAKRGLSEAPIGPTGQAAESYSNMGFIVAGAMMEARTGKAWDELIQQEVFRPLGMDSFQLSFDLDARDLGRTGASVVSGHVSGINGLLTSLGAGYWVAAGAAGSGTYLSLADVVRYLRAHCDRASPFLRRESWDVLHVDPFGGRYAMGWGVAANGTRSHNGSNNASHFAFQFNSRSGAIAAAACNDGREEGLAAVGRLLTRAASTTVTSLPVAGSPEAIAATARAREAGQ